MTADDAIRLLAHEAQRCREVLSRPDLTAQDARDALEIYVLLHPPMLKLLALELPDCVDAALLLHDFHMSLRERQAVMTGADFQNV
ncbi:MAG: hypothetical protein QM813_09390 [Verrucomicrobiota bacterium]